MSDAPILIAQNVRKRLFFYPIRSERPSHRGPELIEYSIDAHHEPGEKLHSQILEPRGTEGRGLPLLEKPANWGAHSGGVGCDASGIRLQRRPV